MLAAKLRLPEIVGIGWSLLTRRMAKEEERRKQKKGGIKGIKTKGKTEQKQKSKSRMPLVSITHERETTLILAFVIFAGNEMACGSS